MVGRGQESAACEVAERIERASKLHIVPNDNKIMSEVTENTRKHTSSLQHSRYLPWSKIARLCGTCSGQRDSSIYFKPPTYHKAGKYNISPSSNVTLTGLANPENCVLFSPLSGSQVANGTFAPSSLVISKPSSVLKYEARLNSVSLTQAYDRGGKSTKCFWPII